MADCENTIRAGRITGNPLNGLCDRICVQVKRVFDGCISRFPSVSIQLNLTNITPGLVFPYTLINVLPSGPASFINQVIIPLDGGRARISGDVVIPVTVRFTDAQGLTGTATSTITQHRDVILAVPVRSLVPYEVSVTASAASEIGTFINATTVNILCCIVIITKIIIDADILVPSYGLSVYPDCTESGEDLCTQLLNLPLFSPL